MPHTTFHINYDSVKNGADKIYIHPVPENAFAISMFPHNVAIKHSLKGDVQFVKTYVQTMLEMLVSDDGERGCATGIDITIPGFPTIRLMREHVGSKVGLIERALALWLDQQGQNSLRNLTDY